MELRITILTDWNSVMSHHWWHNLSMWWQTKNMKIFLVCNHMDKLLFVPWDTVELMIHKGSMYNSHKSRQHKVVVSKSRYYKTLTLYKHVRQCKHSQIACQKTLCRQRKRVGLRALSLFLTFSIVYLPTSVKLFIQQIRCTAILTEVCATFFKWCACNRIWCVSFSAVVLVAQMVLTV